MKCSLVSLILEEDHILIEMVQTGSNGPEIHTSHGAEDYGVNESDTV